MLQHKRANTAGSQDRASIQASSPVFAMESSGSSSWSSGRSVPSEPGSPHNKGLMSGLQASSSRTQRVNAELAVTSNIPRREAPPLASRYNFARPEQYPNPGRSEHAGNRGLNGSNRGEASKPTQSQGTLRRKSWMKRRPHNTKMGAPIVSGLHSTARNKRIFRRIPTPFPGPPAYEAHSDWSESDNEDEDDDLVTPRRGNQLTQACNKPSGSPDKLPSVYQEARPPIRRERWSFRPLNQRNAPTLPNNGIIKKDFPAPQDEGYGSSSSSSFSQSLSARVKAEENAVQKRTAANNSWESSTEDLGPCPPGNSDNPEMLYGSCQGAAGYTPSQPLEGCNRDIVFRPKERSSNVSPVEENGCRICLSSETSPSNPLLSPCKCSGTLKFVHFDCLKIWLQFKIQSGSLLLHVKVCELCKGTLMLNPDTFNWNTFYQEHRPRQVNVQEEVLGPSRRRLMVALQELETHLLSDGERREIVISQRLRLLERIRNRIQRSSDQEPSA